MIMRRQRQQRQRHNALVMLYDYIGIYTGLVSQYIIPIMKDCIAALLWWNTTASYERGRTSLAFRFLDTDPGQTETSLFYKKTQNSTINRK